MATATQQPVEDIVFPEIESLAEQGTIVLREQFQITKIESAEHYTSIARLVLDAASNVKKMEEHVGPQRDAAYKRWKRICGVLKTKTQPWEDIVDRGKPLLASYQAEQERLRLLAEEKERAEQLERDRQVNAAQAEQLAKEGRVEDGLALLECEPVAPVVSTQSSVPRVSGIGSTKIVYECVVEDFRELVKAVAKGRAQIGLLLPNQKTLDKMADGFKETFELPGCKLKKTNKLGSLRPR